MIYMFTLIRTGKDRDKIEFFVMFVKLTQYGVTERKWLYIFFTIPNVLHLINFYNKMTYIESDEVLFFLFSQIIGFYSHICKQCTRLLSMYTVHPIVNFKFHHAANSNPGHGTKFVTLPSSILLYKVSRLR